MLRIAHLRPCALAMTLALTLATAAATSGCSGDSVGAIDQGATIKKATGGDGQARQSPKARADSEEAARLHPKLH